jgi:hypothetical protein
MGFDEKEGKKLIIIFGIIYVIAIIIILVIIWRPKESSNYSKTFTYTKYAEDDVYNRYALKYADDISLKLVLQDYKYLYGKMDKKFIEDNKITEDNFNSYLRNNGYYANGITSERYPVITAGSVVIYPLRLKINNSYKDVNVIENSPSDYTISLGIDYTSVLSSDQNKIKKEYKSNGITFTIESVKNTKTEITLKIGINNIDNNIIRLDLFKYGNIKLVAGNDNKQYDESIEVQASQFNTINKDGYMESNIKFTIPVSVQTDIKSIIFSQVKIDDKNEINIEVPIK